MAEFNGTINFLSNPEKQAVTVVLQDYIGEITLPSDTIFLKILLYGNSKITNAIELNSSDKTDSILVDGIGFCEFMSISATSIEIRSDIQVEYLFGNSLKLQGCSIIGNSQNHEKFIESKGHIWISDCDFKLADEASYNVCIKSPYILFDNVNANISVTSNVFDTNNDVSIENCLNVDQTDTIFVCTPVNLTDSGAPKGFIYHIQKSPDGKISKIISRRKLYSTQPAKIITAYDKFKHSTEYTNVDLHRWIDQDGNPADADFISDDIINQICADLWDGECFDMEPISDPVINAICEDTYEYDDHPHNFPTITDSVILAICEDRYDPEAERQYDLYEVDSRKYDLGIYSLYSYRTTEYQFYSESGNPQYEKSLEYLELP